jgi:dynactin 1
LYGPRSLTFVQIEALRGAVRFLRNENAYLKGYDLLKEIQALPPLYTNTRPPTPPLDRSLTPSDSDDSDLEGRSLRRPTTVRNLATETKLLYRDVMQFSSSRRVIDLSALNTQRTEIGKVWMPKKQTPAHQVWERKLEAEKLSRRVKGLLERAQNIGVVKV